MATKTKTIDWGGNTLKVNTLEVGVTKPGTSGTALSAAELALLDTVTDATGVVASKAVVANSSGQVPYTRVVVEDALAVTLTAAQSGALVVFDKTDGATVTLPASTIGIWYDFLVDVASASVGQKVITPASVFIKGTMPHLKTDNTFTYYAADGTATRSVNLNGTTTGGIAGSRFRLTCRSATVWEVEGLLLASGTVATPFATS